MKAIEESLFAIVVLSQDYAFSSWCLDELHKIVESKENLTVFPVFYGVDPSDVRHQKGIIRKAFEKHEGKFPLCKVRRWRRALTQVANFAGWDARNKHEAGIVKNIAETIWTKLRVKLPSNFAHLVGLQSKVDTMVSLLKIGLNHKCFVGIWGMGGIGKTTLSRVVYETIRDKFEISCFLANVREDSERNGLVYLQKKFLSGLQLENIKISDSHDGVEAIRSFSRDKKVLIVLDDVSHISQLQNLVGDKDWFGAGSRIIVTTRDIHLLIAHDQFEKYEMKMLGRGESLNLLCKHAFKMDYPQQGYWELSKTVVDYAGGLPLALQVLGSFLCKRSQSEWRDTLDKLKQNLHKDIFKTLRISYDGLDDKELKTIFLDIACFFNWEKKVEVIKIFENCGLHPTIGIQVLIEKSLLSTCISLDGQEHVYMHDFLQEMGKNIVLQESLSDAGRRSRSWSWEQIDQVFRGNTGSKSVQSIVLNLKQQFEANWHPNCFSKMSNLRLFCLSNVHLLHGLDSLPTTLKVLKWEKYPLETLPRNIDQLYQLVDLTLHRSRIKELWNGRPFLGMLKFMDLSFSKELTETPDFKGVPNLERLFLEHCIKLVKVHGSLGKLKNLVKLSLRGCQNLVILPRKLELNSLAEFSLYGCSKLEKLPEFGENMNCLSIFDLSGTNIRKVPSSIVHLTNLKELYLHGCNWQAWNSWSFFGYFGHLIGRFLGNPVSKGLKLPNSFSGLSSLRKLDLSFSNLYDGAIPNDLSGLSSLMDFNLRGNNFTSLPVGCISNLVNLEQFDLSNCVQLQSFPQLPPNLIRVYAGCCPSIEPLLDMQHLLESLLIYKTCSLLLHGVIFLHISGDKIPITVFKEQQCHIDPFGASVSIIVDNPNFSYESELWGIAVCLVVKSKKALYYCSRSKFYWRFRALEEDKSLEEPHHVFYVGKAYSIPHLYIAFFPLINTHKFWRHCRQLELQIEVEKEFSINDCGWRLMCKKDF
ncbi:disease resistance protein Roq1-like isoform X2 [Prosopis cineraria]|nr:disease resistance protein Roq1-like isoform X2 [Prosopis cineraria]